MIEVRQVETKADHQIFFEFPWKLYKGNPYWVPPLKSTRKHTLDREHDASWEYLEGEYFIAWRGTEPVGIIAAFINRLHNERWKENIGWFGSFEFIDDPTVAAALLKTAEDYLAAKGCEAVRGPATFTMHAEVGILMDSYDRTPLILMPYNYPYYPQHIESAGYHKVKDLNTWATSKDHIRSEDGVGGRYEKVTRLIDKVKERRNITARTGNKRNPREDFEIIYELYNAGWEDNWGFVPLTKRELDSLIKDLSQIYVPEMSVYTFVEGKPAGFFVGVPDFNQAIHHAYPRPNEPEILALLRVLWHWKLRPKINRVRLPLGGIKAEYRPSGVALVLAFHFFEAFLAGEWSEIDGGWILEDNEMMNGVMHQFNVPQNRHYRMYQKSLK